MSWEKEVLEIEQRKALALAQGGSEAIAVQHAKGRLTIRERIDAVLDAGTFVEHGPGAGFATPAVSCNGTARRSSSTVQYPAFATLRVTCRTEYRDACQPEQPITWPLIAPPASLASHVTVGALFSGSRG